MQKASLKAESGSHFRLECLLGHEHQVLAPIIAGPARPVRPVRFLAVPLFTTRLIISRRGIHHTPKRGCDTHVSPTVLNSNGQLLALCCARSSSHTSSAVWTPFPEASFRGRRTGPAAMVRPYRFLILT